jgi:hypothetical protein
MTLPNTLNGKTGLICFEVGGPAEFEALTLEKVVQKSDGKRFFYDNGFKTATDLVHSHPEPAVFEVGDE